jgi:hypothetical protein
MLPVLRKQAPCANIKLKDVHYRTDEDMDEQANALGAYDAKDMAVSPAQYEDTEYSEQERAYLDVLGMDWEPHSTELLAALDDKSLSEVIEAEDYDGSVLHHSDVKDLPFEKKKRRQQVIVIKMQPLLKPLGKDKGKPTHERRLLMFFSTVSNRVTRAAWDVRPIQLDSFQVAGSSSQAVSESRELGELTAHELGEHLVVEADAAGDLGLGSSGVGSLMVGSLTTGEVAEKERSKAVGLGWGSSLTLDEVAEKERSKAVVLGWEAWGVATPEFQDDSFRSAHCNVHFHQEITVAGP